LGRKRIGKRKYLYFCIAGLIFSFFMGCATVQEMERERDAREHLARGRNLLARGDYEGSLRENQKVLSLSDKDSPGDEALFTMGLIYAHYEYPKKDSKKSLDLFRRLLKAYPQSPLVVQTKFWIGLLQENERLNSELENSNSEKKRLNSEIEKLNKAIEKTKQVDIEIEKKKKELSK
jgi:tetratricopeptide (TPR) repeat protein